MLGNYILHFPLTDFAVSLLAVAALVDVASRLFRRAGWSSATDWLLFTGFGGTLVAIGSGLWLVAASNHPHDATLDLHHKFAYGTLATATIAVAARVFQTRSPKLAWVRTIALVVAALLVSGAGFVGGKMSHGTTEGGHSHEQGQDMSTPGHGDAPGAHAPTPGEPTTMGSATVPAGSAMPATGSATKPHVNDGHAH